MPADTDRVAEENGTAEQIETFAAQLKIARVTAEFYAAYTRYARNLLSREQALAARLGLNAEGVRELNALGEPVTADRLAELVGGLSEAQISAFVASVVRGR